VQLTPTTAWSLGTAGLCVALTAALWFLLIEPERAEATATREQTVAAEQSNAQLQIRIDQLRQEYADLPSRQAELAAIRQALPEEPALAALVRELNEASVDAGVTVNSLTSGAATAVVDPAAVAAVTAGTAPTDTAAATEGTDGATAEDTSGEAAAPEPSAAPADPAAAVPDPGVTAVDGTPAGAVLAAVPVSINTTASFFESTLFVKAVQADISRALLVDSLTVNVVEGDESTEPGTVTTTLSGRVFVFVDPDSLDALDPVVIPTA